MFCWNFFVCCKIKAVLDLCSKNIKFKLSFCQILAIGQENDTYEEIVC